MKQPAVYILASKRNGTLYIGVTSDLVQRVWQHRHNAGDGFTKEYGVHRLVWFEMHEDRETVIPAHPRVIPAHAGIQPCSAFPWIPAFAGMTAGEARF